MNIRGITSACFRALDRIAASLRVLARLSSLLVCFGLAGGIAASMARAATPAVGVNYDGAWDDTSQWNGFDTWFGQTVLYRNSFCAGMNPGDSWVQFDSGPWFMAATLQWLARSPNHREVMALPLLPTSENGNFASVYSGGQAVHFANWAQKLIDAGVANKVIVRLGWEFNQPKIGQPGNWFPWGCGPDHAGFAKAFHAAVVALRGKIPGLKIIWNPNCGGAENWQGCWPTDNNGVPQDSDVDYIGIDPYDDSAWAQRLNNTPGLAEIRSFAAAKGKPECWPEWGLRYNGDNTSYIQNMFNWMTSGTNVFYQAYWNNTCCSTIGIYDTTPIAPNSAALYKSLFGPSAIPPAPTGLTAISGQDTQVPLSWNASAGATSYNVHRSAAPNDANAPAVATGITTTSFTNTGLTNNTTYYFKVKAVNGSGTSGFSNETSGTPSVPPSQPLPNGNYTLAPANAPGLRLQATGTANSANVNIGTASSSNTQQWALTSVGGATYRLSPLNAPNQCLDVNGQFTTSGTNVQLWQYLGQANQKWTLTAVSGGYTLTPTHATTMRLNATGTTDGANVNQLTTNGSTAQTWNVVAVGSQPPPAPTGLAAQSGQNTQVPLSWNASAGATSYNVHRSTAPNDANAPAIATGIAATSYTNTGLANNTTYYFKVKAVNGAGTSGFSNEVSATPANTSPPPAPTGLAATSGQNAQVPLTWNASSGATSYNVYRGTTANGQNTTPIATNITTTSYTNSGLTNGTTYYYKVKAVNANGESAYSNEDSATPSAASGNTHGGTWAVRGIMPSSPTYKKLIAYDTSTATNTSYTAKIWVKGTGKVQLLIRNSNWSATLASLNITATGTWQEYSVSFPSGSNSVVHYTLYDAVGGTAGTIYMDDAWLGTSSGGPNLIGNPGFESGATSWIIESSAPFTILQNP